MAARNSGRFAYHARDRAGVLQTGVVNADTMEAAGQLIADRELFVTKLAPLDDNGESIEQESSTAFGKPVKRRAVLWFITQLGIMVETGIHLPEALDVLARQTEDDQLAEIIENITTRVREGRPLSDAMALHGRAFPKIMISLIRASEKSGTLSTVLNRISVYLLAEYRILRRMKGALTYPAALAGICVIITIFLLAVILPRFASIFASKGAALPAPTRILMGLNTYAAQYWHVALLSIGSLIMLGIWYSRTRNGRWRLDRLRIDIPVIGRVYRNFYISRTFRTISTMVSAGVSLLDTLDTACEVSSNVHYVQLWHDVAENVKHGNNLAAPMMASDLIPESFVHMIDSGDRAGRLGLVFDRLADFAEEEYEESVKTLTQFIEPCIIVIMGGVIGFVAISLLMPLFQAGQVMSQ